MLKLVLGGSGSGKTTLLYSRIRARAEQGRRSILLVPEQFTSSTEGRIYRELGDALSGMVESFSFTSLAERILSAEGGAAVQTLSDAGRAVLVRRALEELQDHVHYYYRHRRSAAFCQMAAQTIDELKSAGLSGAQLAELAPDCGPESGKLSELALIFQGYETLLAGTGMDPSDRLELAAARLEAALARGELPDFLREREVFIDEFDTFNAPLPARGVRRRYGCPARRPAGRFRPGCGRHPLQNIFQCTAWCVRPPDAFCWLVRRKLSLRTRIGPFHRPPYCLRQQGPTPADGPQKNYLSSRK